MEVNFLNQKPCIPSWPGVFHIDILFSVVLSMSTCICVLGPSSSPSSSLVMLFIHSAFSYVFLIAIFSSKIVWFIWHPVVGFIIIIIIIIIIWELFTPVLSFILPLELDRQVFSYLPDSSQFSYRSQQCSSFDGFHLSSYFHVSIPLPNLYKLLRANQLQLASPTPSWFTIF